MPALGRGSWGAAAVPALVSLLLYASPTVIAAQEIAGTVTEADTGAPLAGAEVYLERNGALERTVITDRSGRFAFAVVAGGRYTVRASRFGYQDGEASGVVTGDTSVQLVLTSRPFAIDPVVVTATLTRETLLDAPASATVVRRDEIETAPVRTAMDHLKYVPGVNMASKGLLTATYSARGPRNLTSQAMLVLSDYRYAAVPFFRVNNTGLTPYVADDVERIEVVRGPGAVIYGPNSRRGIVHIIGRSPLQGDEATISLAGGSREYMDVSGRIARAFAGNRAALKVSGRYFRGRDWPFVDEVEQRQRQDAIDLGADPRTLRIGLREDDVESGQAEARLDVRLGDDALWVTSAGFIRSTGIETGAEAGAAQAIDWMQAYAQTRLTAGPWFAIVTYGWGDAGDTYNLRSGQSVTNRSRLLTGQLQWERPLGPTQLSFGADLQYTVPRTEGTVNGRFEADDEVLESGFYAHSTTAISDKLDVLASLRADRHSRIEDSWFASPRAGVVLKAWPTHHFRATYGRVFEQPPAAFMFADVFLGPLGPLPYNIQLFGLGGEGVGILRSCDGLCMRVPVEFGGTGMPVPAEATGLWPVVVATFAAQGVDLSGLPAPTSTDVGTVFGGLNFTSGAFDPITASEITDADPIRRLTEQVFEVGYKGLVSNELSLGADLYYVRADNVFASGSSVLTPNVFLDGASLAAYLGNFLTPDQAAQLAAGAAAIPLGTVAVTASDNSDILVLPFGEQGGSYDYWGIDLMVDAQVSDAVTVSGGYSLVSADSTSLGADEAFLLFNAPKNKGHLEIRYRGVENDVTGYARGRAVQAFSVNAPAYIGRTDDYTVFDVGVAYDFPWLRRIRLSLDIQNIFDNRHTEMVGSAPIGRWIVARTHVSF